MLTNRTFQSLTYLLCVIAFLTGCASSGYPKIEGIVLQTEGVPDYDDDVPPEFFISVSRWNSGGIQTWRVVNSHAQKPIGTRWYGYQEDPQASDECLLYTTGPGAFQMSVPCDESGGIAPQARGQVHESPAECKSKLTLVFAEYCD